ncbi:DUF4393 domain-containing protein [Sphingobacterium bovistauri]|uniref:DUF4393 domain-containing protein n=1 Tax=Sphingobacterium bovistauri TaxID=2781959 RepID=A0ABS7Z9E0_9SPHI|nr:DUF4393 domain-containing protein [Sphingobacterium bovistauri]MCA5006811.1 DUF4393 domain-containing protein [Sphingobacterium bovistauri]
MANNEIVGLVKQTPQILTTIYGDLAQPAVKKVGTALETVFEFSTSILLPIKLLNEKFKLNFEKRLNEYKEKLEKVPEDDICEVNPQIGTPLIEKLSYTTNDEIADLFTNLLIKASSTKTVNLAHPSFVQLVERLSVDEARIIKSLKGKDIIPCITFRAHMKEQSKGFYEILKNGTMLQFDIELLFPQNISTYLDNLTSMGVLDISHGLHKMDDNIYNSIYENYGYDKVNENYIKTDQFSRVEKKKSYYQITDFGKTFIHACNSIEK